MKKLGIIVWIILLCCVILYSFYLAGYSTAPIFKYALIIGLFVWTIELIVQFIYYMRTKLKKRRSNK